MVQRRSPIHCCSNCISHSDYQQKFFCFQDTLKLYLMFIWNFAILCCERLWKQSTRFKLLIFCYSADCSTFLWILWCSWLLLGAVVPSSAHASAEMRDWHTQPSQASSFPFYWVSLDLFGSMGTSNLTPSRDLSRTGGNSGKIVWLCSSPRTRTSRSKLQRSPRSLCKCKPFNLIIMMHHFRGDLMKSLPNDSCEW